MGLHFLQTYRQHQGRTNKLETNKMTSSAQPSETKLSSYFCEDAKHCM